MSEVQSDEIKDAFITINRHYIAIGKAIEKLNAAINLTCEVEKSVYNQEQEDESETISIR